MGEALFHRDRADWETLAAAELKGDPERLRWQTPEGLTVSPL